MNVNATTYESREDWDRYDDQLGGELPRRPRRRFLNAWSALLLALVLGGAGFYAGVRVEKGQLSSSSSSSGLAGALASRFGAAAGGTSTGGTSTGGTGAASTAGGSSGAGGRSGASGTGGFAGRFGGLAGLGGLGGGAGQSGTVSSVDGNTIYLTETSGNMVMVKLTAATKITKLESVSKAKVYPGETALVSGPSGSKGTISATSITDTGNGSSGSGTSPSSATSGSSSSSSPLSSLFGG
jgi:hypothetical protein